MNATLEPRDKPRVLMIYPALIGYRLPMFNTLAERFDFKVLFTNWNLDYYAYDQNELLKRLTADHAHLLNGFEIMNRVFRFGVGKEIDRFKPDVVVTFEYCPASVAVWAKRLFTGARYKHVIMTDDNPEWIKKDVILRKLLRRILLPRLDGLVLLLEPMAEIYRTRFGAKLPMGCVPILQEDAYFRQQLEIAIPEADKLAQKWNLYGQRVLLYVGRLAELKRLGVLLEGFSQVQSRLKNTTLVLVGEGPERQRLKDLSVSLGIENKVIFAGHCEGTALYAWFQIGQVFSLTSRRETFGAVVNEALISGLPVICSKYAGASVLVQNGLNGTRVDPNNLPEVTAAYEEWLEKVSPVTPESLSHVKPLLMQVSFQASMDEYERVLKAALSR